MTEPIEIVVINYPIEVAASGAVLELIERGAQGAKGDAGGDVLSRVAGEAISALRVVRAASDGRVLLASHSTLGGSGGILGVTVNAAIEGGSVDIRAQGEIVDAGFSFAPGNPVYLGIGGTLVSTPPPGIVVVIGWAPGATRLIVRPELPLL